jgi:flavin reductase (DIM6/NTAB) family NADH-FMN oxidoreductase RutF
MLKMAAPPQEDLDRYFLTTVALITTRSSHGDNVMAAEWTFNLSYDPLLVGVAVNPHHVTHAAIEESKEFGVNMAARGQFPLTSFAGGFSRREADKLSSSSFATRPGVAIGASMLEGSLAQLECKLVAAHRVGDHTLFVGQVVAGKGDESREPLVLYRGYRMLGEKVVRGHNLTLALTPEDGGAVRADGMYYADVREGREVTLEAFDDAGQSLARGNTVTDRGGYFEWRPGATARPVARAVATTPEARGEAALRRR